MHVTKADIPTKIEIPGATVRQALGFGDASGSETMGAEYFSLAAGTDITPLLQGLEGDLCQAPHWGYLLAGEVVVTYADGSEETNRADDLFHWPAGHTVRVVADAEIVLFSPQHEHTQVMDHMLGLLAG